MQFLGTFTHMHNPNMNSYLEGVTAPDGPILEKSEGTKDGKLGETAS